MRVLRLARCLFGGGDSGISVSAQPILRLACLRAIPTVLCLGLLVMFPPSLATTAVSWSSDGVSTISRCHCPAVVTISLPAALAAPPAHPAPCYPAQPSDPEFLVQRQAANETAVRICNTSAFAAFLDVS